MHDHPHRADDRVWKMSKKSKFAIAIAAVAIGLAIASQFVTIFVIQPIGAIPEGRTILISRLTNLHFIDSPDGVCGREMGGVSLLCRGMVAGRVAEKATVYARLPYSAALYNISTGGKSYDR
jgi:ascorbate-specific PTS system EIIC-type component UlaA